MQITTNPWLELRGFKRTSPTNETTFWSDQLGGIGRYNLPVSTLPKKGNMPTKTEEAQQMSLPIAVVIIGRPIELHIFHALNSSEPFKNHIFFGLLLRCSKTHKSCPQIGIPLNPGKTRNGGFSAFEVRFRVWFFRDPGLLGPLFYSHPSGSKPEGSFFAEHAGGCLHKKQWDCFVLQGGTCQEEVHIFNG